MDKQDWIAACVNLKTLLSQKKAELDKPKRLLQDIEEIELTIAAYEKKIKSLK
jgi:hypothetical protein